MPASPLLLLRQHVKDRLVEHRSVGSVIFRAAQIDLHPFAHLRPSHGLERDDIAVRMQQFCSVMLGELDAYALLVQADAQLLPGVIGGLAEHLAGSHQRVAQQQVVEHGLVLGIEFSHNTSLIERRTQPLYFPDPSR